MKCFRFMLWKKSEEKETEQREIGSGSGVSYCSAFVINLSLILMGTTDTKLNLRARVSEG